MPIVIELIILIILYFILKELVSGMFNIVLIIVAIIVIFFVLGGTGAEIGGILGEISKFFKSLPTSEFINFVIQAIKDIIRSVSEGIRTTT